jgi:hypothetical protein
MFYYGAVLGELAHAAEIVFADAPHILNPVDIADAFGSTEHTEPSGATEDPALKPRGWWTKGKEYRGLEESIALLKEMLIKDTYVVSDCNQATTFC